MYVRGAYVRDVSFCRSGSFRSPSFDSTEHPFLCASFPSDAPPSAPSEVKEYLSTVQNKVDFAHKIENLQNATSPRAQSADRMGVRRSHSADWARILQLGHVSGLTVRRHANRGVSAEAARENVVGSAGFVPEFKTVCLSVPVPVRTGTGTRTYR